MRRASLSSRLRKVTLLVKFKCVEFLLPEDANQSNAALNSFWPLFIEYTEKYGYFSFPVN